MRKLSSLAVFVALIVLIASALTAADCPTVVVIIPETATINRLPRQIPDPAAETEIIHCFLEYGFIVVDPGQVAAIRYQGLVQAGLAGDRASLAQLSERFSAVIGPSCCGSGFATSWFWARRLLKRTRCAVRFSPRGHEWKCGPSRPRLGGFWLRRGTTQAALTSR